MSTQTSTNHTYTIMETARLTGLPESTLRYYESIGLIEPIRRDSSSKYRVYSEDDVNLILGISCLSATGMALEDMRTYLENQKAGAEAAKEQILLLEAQDHRLAEEEHFLKLRQKYLRLKVRYWKAVEAKDNDLAKEIIKEGIVMAKELKDTNLKLNKGAK
jgi:DNA-binding transcriptional MerR regulator